MGESKHSLGGAKKSGRSERAAYGSAIAFLREHLSYSEDKCLIWPFAVDRHGYPRVGSKKSPLEARTAHRLMCIWKHGQPPFDGAEAAHSCGVRKCVNPIHIRWKTRLANNRERYLHGTMPMGESVGGSKLTEQQVLEIYADQRRQVDIAAEYGCAQTLVSKIKRGEFWSHVTGHAGNVPRPRLEVETVLSIYRDKRPNSALAQAYGVSLSTVKKIKNGTAWAKITNGDVHGIRRI